MYATIRHKPTPRGFTLIEVLVASLILGITVAAVSTVIRTGLRAWRNGHDASELSQTVRITQDVILRDMDNIFFKNESDYNGTFRSQITALSQKYGGQIAKNGNTRDLQSAMDAALHGRRNSRLNTGDNNNKDQNEVSLQAIAPPVNLSFHGSETQLSFARSYQARFAGDQETWGLRRVTYFLRDKTLFRREEDPYGLRVSPANDPSPDQKNFDPVAIIRNQMERLFAVADNLDPKEDQPAQEAPALLPTQVRVEEPLCLNVETVKIIYGFFSQGEWVEDQSWDSQSSQHRCPPMDPSDPNNPNSPNNPAQLNRLGGQALPFAEQVMLQQLNRPDDLPGYVKIQLEVRTANGKGRLFTFKICHSLPEAKELDVMLMDPNSPYKPPPRMR